MGDKGHPTVKPLPEAGGWDWGVRQESISPSYSSENTAAKS